ncbi:MAG: cystathionine gamma-synthase [Acidobacteriota bacterium]|nr:cystathionine gamma-synthase [Acidobacteriota bacterium]
MDFETRTVHAGQDPDPQTGAVNVPVYLTSTYQQLRVGEVRFADYARGDNPTRHALEDALADLEGASAAVAFASGLAAVDAVVRTLSPGDRVLMSTDAYGGTYRLLTRVFGRFGVATDVVDLADPLSAAAPWREGTRLVWVETPSNPFLRVVDIAEMARLAHARDARLVVDNTFATPYLQRPLALGADVVVHSTTKYLGGHSDVIGGAALTSDPGLAEELRFAQFAVGAVPGPLDCYLVLRGLRTLAVRMDRHQENARAVAAFFGSREGVARVWFPGLASHPQHDLARRQMSGPGAMVSVELDPARVDAVALVEACRVFTLAESLGGVESLIEVPARMTHLSTAGSQLEVPANLVRLSVGIESAADLVADLERALAAAWR